MFYNLFQLNAILLIIMIIYQMYLFINTLFKKRIIITIDGNIGSGKSTFIKKLKDHFGDRVYFAKEPVDEWQNLKDENNLNILEHFYKNKKRWGYTFQNLAFITRTLEMNRAFESGKNIIISERSIMTDYNIFAKMLYQDGDISKIEMDIYKFWYKTYSKYDTYNIYLKTSIDNCQSRIEERSRQGEENGISKEYLETLQDLHDDWLLNLPNDKLMVINGNCDFKNDVFLQNMLIQQVLVKFNI